ncbi:MAG TPA: D-glycerate dehydrogenase [Chloroflexi bacterium]|nr:D-glycerate dehydrogenase [Chloroflexota bacterium]
MKVYVTRLIPEEGLDMVRRYCDVEVWEGELPLPYEVLLEKARDIDGLLSLLTDRIDAPLMDAAPKLRVISNYAVGYDNIDVTAATQRGIIVGHTPGVLTETVADFTMALLLATARRVVEGERFVKAGKWKTWGPTLLLGRDVHGATLGLVGLGRIGASVARRARGFAMRILYHDIARREDLERELGLIYTDFETLLGESDFVSLHVPLTEDTHHLMSKDQFGLMKPTAILINTSRGPVVDQQALYEALKSGRIASAAMDVTDPEPIAPDDPLLSLDNCLIVPHMASASIATRTKMATMAAENLIAGLRGEIPPHPVNPEALRR